MSDARSADPALWERYTRERGRVHLTGLQALVRMALEQLRRDARAGRKIGRVLLRLSGLAAGGLRQLAAQPGAAARALARALRRRA